jgi:hypothetical protein
MKTDLIIKNIDKQLENKSLSPTEREELLAKKMVLLNSKDVTK